MTWSRKSFKMVHAVFIQAPPASVSTNDVLQAYDIFTEKIPDYIELRRQFTQYRQIAQESAQRYWPNLPRLTLSPADGEKLSILRYNLGTDDGTLFRVDSQFFHALHAHDTFVHLFGKDLITYFNKTGIEGRVGKFNFVQ